MEIDHVVVDVRLRDGGVGGTNMRDEFAEPYGIEALDGVVKSRVVYVIDGCSELVACDGGNDKIHVPSLSFGEVGCACCFAGRECGRLIDGIVGGHGIGDFECRTVALEVQDRVL